MKLRMVKNYGYSAVSKIILFITILSGSLVSLCHGYSDIDPKTLAKDQVFHRGNGEEPESLDPHKSTGIPANNVLIDLYEGLMTYDQSGNLILGQAKSYTISDDLTVYTFTLKDNLKWSNGDELTAADFVVGLRRTVDPKVGSIYSDILKPIKNASQIIAGEMATKQLKVTAKDDKTLVIELEKPTPYFLELLTHATSLPIYRPNLEKYPDSFTQPANSVTNGPFKLKDWVVNSHITLVKNDYYHEADKVILKQVNFYPIAEQSVELKRYRAGDLDYTNAIPDIKFNWIKQNLSNELYIAPQLATYYYGFNVTKPPFKDNPDLRKALALAIDKKIIAERVLRSGQIATDNFVPANTNNYNAGQIVADRIASLDKIDQNKRPELAKEYYKKAGYGPDKPVNIKITYNTQESHKSIAVAISAMWKKALGVTTELVNQEWKVFLRTRQEKKDTQFFREGWVGDFNDPMTFLDLYVSDNPQNSSGYKNVQYDKLIEQAGLEKDLTKRAVLLRNAENILLDDMPLVPLYTYVSRHLVRENIGGFATNLLDRTYDKYIYIKNA